VRGPGKRRETLPRLLIISRLMKHYHGGQNKWDLDEGRRKERTSTKRKRRVEAGDDSVQHTSIAVKSRQDSSKGEKRVHEE